VAAISELEGAAHELNRVRLALMGELTGRVGYPEAAALGALLADAVDAGLYGVPPAVRDQLPSIHLEIDTVPLSLLEAALLTGPQAEVPGGVIVAFFEEVERARTAAGLDDGPRARLGLAFKSAYFLVRSLQDGLYRVGYEVVTGRPPRRAKYASMVRALDDENDPVRQAMGDFSDKYMPWFKGWRHLRNSLKTGRPAGIVGPSGPGGDQEDIGVTFATVTEEGVHRVDLARATRVSDVTRALEMTRGVCEVVREQLAH
jgi:hypothetical protein